MRVIGFIVAIALVLLAWRAFTQRRIAVNQKAQDSITNAASVIRTQDTIIGSAMLALAAVHAAYQAALDRFKAANPEVDTTDLDTAATEAKAQSAALSQAIAVNTIASDEVHTDDGGTGTQPATDAGGAPVDGGTVIDPTTVDTSTVAPPADPVEQQQQQQQGGDPIVGG